MNELTTFAKRMKQKRNEKQISLRELASKTGMSATTISSYERGTKSPSLNNIINIANYLDVSIDWLCGREEEENPKNLKDIIEILLKLTKYFIVEAPDSREDFLLCFDTERLPSDCQDVFRKFFADWEQLQKLTKGGDILYKQMIALWLNEELKKLEKFPINKGASAHGDNSEEE